MALQHARFGVDRDGQQDLKGKNRSGGLKNHTIAAPAFGGKGKVSDLMGDVAKGIKSFKKGMAEEDVTDSSKSLDATVEEVAPKSATKAKAKS